jgi:hypothetical protein
MTLLGSALTIVGINHALHLDLLRSRGFRAIFQGNSSRRGGIVPCGGSSNKHRLLCCVSFCTIEYANRVTLVLDNRQFHSLSEHRAVAS